MTFRDRTAAGQDLARELILAGYGQNSVVYAIPRGGVPVAAEVARALGAPLGLVVPRKIGHPLSPEYAIGAVTAWGEPVWEKSELGYTNKKWREHQLRIARHEARRRIISYQVGQPPPADGKIAIIVDDGLATGLTAVAAVKDIRRQNPEQVVVAVPVASEDCLEFVADYADDLVVGFVPPGFFGSVSGYYSNFEEVGDEEVRQIMASYSSNQDTLDLEGLNAVLATVRRFPVTAWELKHRANRLMAPDSVVRFFESIPGDLSFGSKAEVMRRSAQTELLMEEEHESPEEHLHSYD